MHSQDLRSPLKRAAGLGSAGDGVGRWWMERVTAVALVPLALWFVASIIALAGSDHAAFVAWLREPLAALLMVLLLATLFAHLALGLNVHKGVLTHPEVARAFNEKFVPTPQALAA